MIDKEYTRVRAKTRHLTDRNTKGPPEWQSISRTTGHTKEPSHLSSYKLHHKWHSASMVFSKGPKHTHAWWVPRIFSCTATWPRSSRSQCRESRSWARRLQSVIIQSPRRSFLAQGSICLCQRRWSSWPWKTTATDRHDCTHQSCLLLPQ